MHRKFIYAAIAVMSVLIAYNALASATTPTSPIAAEISSNFKSTNIIDYLTITVKKIALVESFVASIGDNQLNTVEIEDINSLARVNTALINSDLQYVAQIVESEPDGLQAGTYRVELFENGVSKGALYIKQTVVEPKVIEGVTGAWDIGSDIPSNAIYTVKITECPCS